MCSWLRRPAANVVHRIDVHIPIPLTVRNLLSKSMKFVPDSKPMSLGHLQRGVADLQRQLGWRLLLGRPLRPRRMRCTRAAGATADLSPAQEQQVASFGNLLFD